MIDKQAAEQLWSNLRNALQLTEDGIREIVEARAWEPLGYETFAEAWADRTRGVKLASEAMKAAVIYAMFDQGSDDATVALSMHGVGPETVREVRRNYSLGVPASQVVRVRSFTRRKPSPPQIVKFPLDFDEYGRFTEAARALGTTVGEIAAMLVKSHFEALAAQDNAA